MVSKTQQTPFGVKAAVGPETGGVVNGIRGGPEKLDHALNRNSTSRREAEGWRRRARVHKPRDPHLRRVQRLDWPLCPYLYLLFWKLLQVLKELLKTGKPCLRVIAST